MKLSGLCETCIWVEEVEVFSRNGCILYEPRCLYNKVVFPKAKTCLEYEPRSESEFELALNGEDEQV